MGASNGYVSATQMKFIMRHVCVSAEAHSEHTQHAHSHAIEKTDLVAHSGSHQARLSR